MAGIIVSKLVIEHQDVTFGSGDKSFGVLVDEKIEAMLLSGETLQEITLNIDPSEWLLLKAAFGSDDEPYAKTKSKSKRSY